MFFAILRRPIWPPQLPTESHCVIDTRRNWLTKICQLKIGNVQVFFLQSCQAPRHNTPISYV